MIERVCLNFDQYCNMQCLFCYIRFDKDSTYDPTVTGNVIRRAKELGAEVITFGGGDPFLYQDFSSLLRLSKTLGVFTHVDTNAVNISSTKLEECSSVIDMIAIPIDGTPKKHDYVRARNGHFFDAIKSLYLIDEFMDREVTRVKINTVLTRHNCDALHFISRIVEDFSVDVWSIYQYWRLENNAYKLEGFDITEEECDAAVLSIPPNVVNIVELNKSSERVRTYFFTSHNGMVYTHNPDNYTKYLYLGSIFSDRTIEEWNRLGGNSLRCEVQERYNNRGRI